ncbi:hypothetical protein GF359_09775 [candidate division WOR-3 bacterium]|uniref:T9SS type A sorting domain-containing protein n=1 Tax=candidate division WOR-3 bacterium TaxID=2052148 RepID=A0A9D5QD90_UNCW3|nr:hypothetical protein [candidate division WOR-3 bacterium]MBD3365488.1 hypothetical protein [candidate division WOR-3 bacterium]
MKKLGFSYILMGVMLSVTPYILYGGWIFTYGGADNDLGQSVCESADGGFVATGQTGENLLLTKTNSSGDLVWNHSYPEMSGTFINAIDGGGYIITGSKDDQWLGQTLFIMKTNSEGDSQWVKIHGKQDEKGCEGNSILAIENGYLITGINGSGKLWILKTDSEGELIWEKEYGVQGHGYSIREVSKNRYVITGELKLGEEREDLCLLKIDENGDTIWVKTYGISGDYEHGHSVEPTGDGGFFVAGEYGSDTWLLKTDSEGDTLWSKVDNSGRTYQLVETSDGNYVLAGRRYTGTNKLDMLILKVDGNGNKMWQKTYGGSNDDIGYSVYKASQGGYIFTGQTRSFGDGSYDLWMIRTNSAGDTSWICENPPGLSDWDFATTVGSALTFRYRNKPEGFFAKVYDASGSIVDRIYNRSASGVITWGEGYDSGVYFIVPIGCEFKPQKVILVR